MDEKKLVEEQRVIFKRKVIESLNLFLETNENKLSINRRFQIYNLVSFFRQRDLLFSFHELGVLSSKLTESIISRQYNLFISEPGQGGRCSILSLDETTKIFDFIEKKQLEKNPCSYRELLIHLLSIYPDKNFTMWWVYKFIEQNSSRIKSMDAICMEEERVNVSKEEVTKWMFFLKNRCNCIPCSFIYNMDESGFQKWAGKIDGKVIVMANACEKDCIIPTSRSGNRTTMVGCICMDGSYLDPFFVVHRATIDVDMLLHGVGLNPNSVRTRDLAFMNTQLFEEWVEFIFIASLKEKRKKLMYYGESVLVLDGFKSHLSSKAIELLSLNGVRIMLLPPHSSHLLQPLDVGIFGLHKRELSNQARIIESKMESSEQTKHLCSIVSFWEKVATTNNIISAFVSCGFVPRALVVDNNQTRPTICCEIIIKSLSKTGSMFLQDGREEAKKELEDNNLSCGEEDINSLLRKKARTQKSILRCFARKTVQIA